MEMVQVGFLVIGALFLWSSMSLTAPAPITPNDVTGELNSLLEFIQKIRNKGTPLAHSDRRKQQALDKVFDEAEETIQQLLASIEQKGEVIKHRTGTDEVEYKQGWDALNQSIVELKNAFSSNIALINQEFDNEIPEEFDGDMDGFVRSANELSEKMRELHQKRPRQP